MRIPLKLVCKTCIFQCCALGKVTFKTISSVWLQWKRTVAAVLVTRKQVLIGFFWKTIHDPFGLVRSCESETMKLGTTSGVASWRREELK